MNGRPRIVCVGAGHASLIALDRLGRRPDAEITLVSDGPRAHYSGMVPGWIEGLYSDGAMDIPLAPFAAARGIAFRDARVEEITEEAVRLWDGWLPYDILVLNTGAVAAPAFPGETAAVIPAKPFPTLLAGLRKRLADATSFAVIGAGASGAEVALALRHRRPDAAVALVEAGPDILAAFPAAFRRRVAARLAVSGIDVMTGSRPVALENGALHLADGREVASDAALAFTGPKPPPFVAETPFATTPNGFIATDATMCSLSHPNVLAVGDVATNVADPRPKAGVFAVRQGRPLAKALSAMIAGDPPPPVTLQRRGLVLLSVGGRRAVGVRNGIVLEGHWVWRLKDRLDRGFIARLTREVP